MGLPLPQDDKAGHGRITGYFRRRPERRPGGGKYLVILHMAGRNVRL